MLDAPDRASIKTLAALRDAEARCVRCLLYKSATQVVPGEGRLRARLMLVGEQPGDKEDLAGKPFVGPAGRILDRALEQAGIARDDVFVTTPSSTSSTRCAASGACTSGRTPTRSSAAGCGSNMSAQPSSGGVIVALGATAARSVLRRGGTIGQLRARAHVLEDDTSVFVTIHPSFLLRIKDESDQDREFRMFVVDLRRAKGRI
jgi:uracil-DNA glycosylase family protein